MILLRLAVGVGELVVAAVSTVVELAGQVVVEVVVATPVVIAVVLLRPYSRNVYRSLPDPLLPALQRHLRQHPCLRFPFPFPLLM
jgi:hypothetical protein